MCLRHGNFVLMLKRPKRCAPNGSVKSICRAQICGLMISIGSHFYCKGNLSLEGEKEKSYIVVKLLTISFIHQLIFNCIYCLNALLFRFEYEDDETISDFSIKEQQ